MLREQTCNLDGAAVDYAVSTAAAQGFMALVNEYRRDHYCFGEGEMDETDAMNAMVALADSAETLRTEGEKLRKVVREVVDNDPETTAREEANDRRLQSLT